MRSSHTCSNTSPSRRRRQLQKQHTGDEESVTSDKTGYSLASSSSFSLQDCINEFRARKVHRSSQSQSQSNPNTDDDLINQNKSNKHSERISKPCKDGFCYCFTSDSDDFRIYKSDEKRRTRKSETTADEQISDLSNNNHNQKTSSNSIQMNSKPKQSSPTKNGLSRTVTAVSTLKDSSRTSKAPLIHIIQEIHNNCVVSEVRVNKNKIPCKSVSPKKQHVSQQKVIHIPQKQSIESQSQSQSPVYVDRVSEIDSLTEHFKESSLNTSSRSSDKNGGRLLQKRLSGSRIEYKPRNLSTPPRKPPRNIPVAKNGRSSDSTASSIRIAEKVLDEFLRQKGIPIPKMTPKHKNKRRSFPLPKSSLPANNELMIPVYQKQMPSCPSLSDIERLPSEKSTESGGVIQEDQLTWDSPKIREMLNLDTKTKHFQSNNPECGPQVGWKIPPKLDIDTVDGAYHNLVANMESKITPVKSEMPNNKTESQKFILAEQLKNFVSHSPWSSKKGKNKENITKSNSFLNSSRTKLLRFVTMKSPDKQNIRSIGVQTSMEQLSKDRLQEKRFSLQSPPGSYFSNTPAKTSKCSQTEFDFSRTVKSPPRKDKIPQRKQLFPSVNVAPKQKPPRKINSKKNTNTTYKSYNTDLDKDLNLTKMGQVLSNIRNRLEASDDHAVETFRDIKRKEQVAANKSFSYDCVDGGGDGYGCQSVFHVSAQADVHNDAEPSYSEIEEDSFYVTGSPINENTTGIEHFVMENDPKAIYAKINKTPKKSSTLHSGSFNNIMEQNSPPKLRNVSKTDLSIQSEIFLENLTSENKALCFEKAEKVQNAHQEEKLYMELNNLDESYVTVNSFQESDAVSYELPEDCTNPITVDTIAGNESTPKKTTHFTKFDMATSSEECLHQTSSCPATPGWLLYEEQQLVPMEGESMSLQEESSEARNKIESEKQPSFSMWRYRTLKDKLRKSFRKSRHFIKNESKRLSGTLTSQKTNNEEPWDESSLHIGSLFAMDDKAPVNDQLTQAVSICRLIPELEDTPEMVEAERLLLYSTVKQNVQKLNTGVASKNDVQKGSVLLKSVRMPIRTNTTQELFFNYYYIGVFSNGRQVKSTQSAECTNGEAVFRNCNISFDSLSPDGKVRCDIFMLRLRKVSTPRKPVPKTQKLGDTSASSEEILSRFRPHASFSLEPRDFKPYNLIDNCPRANKKHFCLHAESSFESQIIPQARSTNLLEKVHIYGEIEQFFPQHSTKGFLNVQDINKAHNWTLRWCELISLKLKIWNSPDDVAENEPILQIDLCSCKSQPIQCAAREICARSKSFCLELLEAAAENQASVYVFSADSVSDLNSWISALNEVIEFIADWIK